MAYIGRYNSSNIVDLKSPVSVDGVSIIGSGGTISNATLDSTVTFPAGFIKNVQVFSSSGTYTKTAGVNDVFVMVYGGSGGGGGSYTGGANGGSGGTSSFGSYCSASGGAGGLGQGGQTQARLGAANGSGSGGNVNSNSTVGGAAGNRYAGGSARDIGQYGGAGGFACEFITGVASTVSVTVGGAGSASSGDSYANGLAGAAGYVIVFELL
jgi:hypothetical protein